MIWLAACFTDSCRQAWAWRALKPVPARFCTHASRARLAHRHSPDQNGIMPDGSWAFVPPAFAGSHVCEAVEECEAGARRPPSHGYGGPPKPCEGGSLGKGGLLRRVPPKC